MSFLPDDKDIPRVPLYTPMQEEQHKKEIFRKAKVKPNEYKAEKVTIPWKQPDNDTLKGILREMIIEDVSLVDACKSRHLPLLVVLDSFLRFYPDAWGAYNAARKEGLKERVKHELVARLDVTLEDCTDKEGRFAGWKGISADAKKYIEVIDHGDKGGIKIKLSSRVEAIRLLGKEIGMFKTNVKHEHQVDLATALKQIKEAKGDKS